MQPKLYLAGPEVFLPNAVEHAEKQRQLCHKYGFIPLHPMDNNLDLGNKDYETAMRIYRGDVKQVQECDIVVANCNPFRSVTEMDPSTAYELGYGNALGKVSYGYIESMIGLVERTIRDYPTRPHPNDPTLNLDKEGYVVTDAFGTSINLMMQCGMSDSGGRLVEGNFEDCLKVIREDLDSGKLKLGQTVSTELGHLMRFIGARYTFTPDHYPVMKQMSPDQQQAFAVSHSVHHMLKNLGKIAGEVESVDHREWGLIDRGVLKEAVVKMLINTLKLAEVQGITAQDLAQAVPAMMKSK